MTGRILVLMLGAALAACSSPQSRIKKNQAAFDAYPPAVQGAIRQGTVEIGFTDEQVVMALGKPSRVYSQKTAGANQEVWEYGVGGGPSVGLGFGMSSMGGGSGYGTSVGVASDSMDPRAKTRVILQNGVVVSVERREK
ncbi:MAG: hypothetical protein Q8T11_18135 [Elusimicrobiota bacterium]|nr:hypothetical protein [Elusimicrobiota bacterium]